MQDLKFIDWMSDRGVSKKTTQNRISNLRKIELHYADLDQIFEKGLISELMAEFKYTKKQFDLNEPVNHEIPIDGNQLDGTRTYRQSLRLYIKFKLSK